MLTTAIILLIYIFLGVPVGVFGIFFTLITGNIMPLYRTGMWTMGFGVRAAGIRVMVSGRENIPVNIRCIFMANHVSNLDPTVLLPLLPGRTSVLLKQSLMRIPLLGYAMKMAGFVPIQRRQSGKPDREHAIEDMQRAAEALRSGLHITIFPEGTRSVDGCLLPFKKGPFYLAVETGAPVVPVSISGTERMMPKGSFFVRRGTAHVVFHPPVWTGKGADQNADRDALMHSVREAIASGLPEPMR
jgi:1-acyl-sn-glycerol-3-phosphate acyltransferase